MSERAPIWQEELAAALGWHSGSGRRGLGWHSGWAWSELGMEHSSAQLGARRPINTLPFGVALMVCVHGFLHYTADS